MEDTDVEAKHLKRGELAVLETIRGDIVGGGANDVDIKSMDKKTAPFLIES